MQSLLAYGVYILQLIGYTGARSTLDKSLFRGSLLTNKFISSRIFQSKLQGALQRIVRSL
jgi:hypothetical protein